MIKCQKSIFANKYYIILLLNVIIVHIYFKNKWRDGMLENEDFDFISWKNRLNNELLDFWNEIINY